MARNVEELPGGILVRYLRHPDWPSGTWWLFEMTGEAPSGQDTYRGIIRRTDHPTKEFAWLWNGHPTRRAAAVRLIDANRATRKPLRRPLRKPATLPSRCD